LISLEKIQYTLHEADKTENTENHVLKAISTAFLEGPVKYLYKLVIY
jgi:hypothetical protein